MQYTTKRNSASKDGVTPRNSIRKDSEVTPPRGGRRAIVRAAADGFLTLGLEPFRETMQVLKQRDMPFVMVDSDPIDGVSCINIDDQAIALPSGYLQPERLLEVTKFLTWAFMSIAAQLQNIHVIRDFNRLTNVLVDEQDGNPLVLERDQQSVDIS